MMALSMSSHGESLMREVEVWEKDISTLQCKTNENNISWTSYLGSYETCRQGLRLALLFSMFDSKRQGHLHCLLQTA